jgi:hypothetical protein
MRSIKPWLAPALMTALVLVGAAVAQPPFQKGPPRGPLPPSRISVDDIVERIMAFDKNKDGKVTKDELPERMHGLIARGDTNKDGALDRDEIRKLASATGGPGPNGVAGGPGRKGVRAKERVGPGAGDFIRGPGPGFGDIEGVVDDLKLPDEKKDRALAVVKAHRENVRKLMDQARAELLQKMKKVLSEEELKDFQAALDRPRGVTVINLGGEETLREPPVLRKKVDDLRRPSPR